jgi:hypothetical protein
MYEACRTHGANEKCIHTFGWKVSMEDLDTDGMIILKWIIEK